MPLRVCSRLVATCSELLNESEMRGLPRHRLNCCLPQDPSPAMKPNHEALTCRTCSPPVEGLIRRHVHAATNREQLLPTQRTTNDLLTKNTTSSPKGMIETNSSVCNREMQPLFLDIFICFTLDFRCPQQGSAIALVLQGNRNFSGISPSQKMDRGRSCDRERCARDRPHRPADSAIAGRQ